MLIQNCFIAKPAFANHLMEINKVTFDLQQKKCISENIVTLNKNWDIEEFKGDQKRARTEASQSYNNNIEKLIKMIENVQKVSF